MVCILGKLFDSKTCQMTYRTGSRRYQFINKLSIDRPISITNDRWRPYFRFTKFCGKLFYLKTQFFGIKNDYLSSFCHLS